MCTRSTRTESYNNKKEILNHYNRVINKRHSIKVKLILFYLKINRITGKN